MVACTRSGRPNTSAATIPTRSASDIAGRGVSNVDVLRAVRNGDRSLLGQGSHGTDIEGGPGARPRPPGADGNGFTRPAPDASLCSQRPGPWGVPTTTRGCSA